MRVLLVAFVGLFLFLMVPQGRAAEASGLKPTYLRCEYLVNPLGIDVPEPRLSWIVESGERGQKQTAYQVLVAGNEDGLKKDQGDLWDSGKVSSDDTTAIVYAGRKLASRQRCYWKVKVWDREGRPSAWSEPSLWSMGLLAPAEWTGQWIGYDKHRHVDRTDAPFEGAKWIWFPDQGKEAKGMRLFVTSFNLSPNTPVEKAQLYVTANGQFSVHINSHKVVSNGPDSSFESPRGADVANRLIPGVNDIRVGAEVPAKGPAGLLVKLEVKTADGQTHTLVSDDSWKTTDQLGEDWHKRPLDTSSWPASKVLGEYGASPWGKLKYVDLFPPPPAYLRTGFQAHKPIRHATVYATALGLFDLYLNGRRVTDDRLNPGWSDYHKRLYYRAYDVTDLVRSGDNALGALLADGWYSGYIGWGRVREHYGKHPRLRAQLYLDYADGSQAIIATGPNWKASTGPTREADLLMGETYDARLEHTGWDEPGFNDSRWDPVATGAEMEPLLEHHPGPAVRQFAELKPVQITEPEPHVYVLNLGQNFAGVARLKVSGERGQKITLRFAERLNPDGTVYTTNLRGARATDTYICRGQGVETWEPRFTFHGFQYVEITGLKEPPTKDTITGIAISSDTPVAGQFTCSDPMVTQLHSNIYWTQRANFIDIPTDCPQRDERLGWTGDAQVYIATATLNTDVQAFFTKWLVDLEDGQRADGQFPKVAPVKVAGEDGGPAWADAGVICPWTIYDVYGDRRELARHYDSMVRFIAFCKNRSTPDLLPPAKYHAFGDWLNIQADTPNDIIYMAYFAHSTDLTARAAEVLGKKEDAAQFHDLFEKIKAAFNKAYVAPDGRIKGNTQTCYVLALAFDLLGREKQEAAARYLIEDIQNRGWHLSTGFIGTKDLMLVLARIGRNDVAYRLLENVTFPSWGFSIKQGATSIWERWDGWTPEKGFQDPGMNSFAHYSFGAVYQWMAENIGGIRKDGPAYKRLLIAPQPGGKLTSADTVYRSIHGTIETHWKKEGNRFLLDVTIPANTAATVTLPVDPSATVTESGHALASAEGVKEMLSGPGRRVLFVESGTYHFASK